MLKVIATSSVLLALTVTASAQSCAENFRVEGTPMLTAVNYRTSQTFPSVAQGAALQRLASGVAAEGFSGIRVDKGVGAITAVQETSGSGRPQTLRVVARKAGKGTRVDAVFMVQIGQMANTDVTRSALCRIVGSAAR